MIDPDDFVGLSIGCLVVAFSLLVCMVGVGFLGWLIFGWGSK